MATRPYLYEVWARAPGPRRKAETYAIATHWNKTRGGGTRTGYSATDAAARLAERFPRAVIEVYALFVDHARQRMRRRRLDWTGTRIVKRRKGAAR